MAYIGNGRTLLVLGSNVKDDLVPDNTSATFNLSQEVPGGYEGNVYVFKQTYITEQLITGVVGNNATTGISISYPGSGANFTITTSNAAIAAALSDIKETTKLYADANHTITISGSTGGQNNGTFLIVGCTYSGSDLTITLARTGLQGATPDTGSITLDRGYSGFWEVLEPEIDYTIGGTGANLNKQITFAKVPKVNDKIYVVHKGDATYNLVPSDNSVGPNQLSQNLREFVKQVETGNGSVTTFALSQNSINSKAILVTVNGLVQEGEEWNGTSVSSNSDYALNVGVNPNTIIFRTAPSSGAKIRILHLGFSTVSRRAALSPGQVGSVDNNSIGTAQLKNGAVITDKIDNSAVVESKIADGAVTTVKLANNSVTSPKILLVNNTHIRSLLSNGTTAQNLLSVGTDDVTNLNGASQVSIGIGGAKIFNATTTSLSPETTDTQSLGTSTKKFSDLHLSGTANVANINVSGTVDGVDISAFQTSVNATLQSLQATIDVLMPIGTIVPYSGSVASGTPLAGRWLLCDGAEISRTAYPALNALFSSQLYPFGSGNGTTTFNLPDMRRRVPIGRHTENIGVNDGVSDVGNRSFTHTHGIPGHTHGLNNHTHAVPGHHHAYNTAIGTNLIIGSSGGHDTAINIFHTHTIPQINSSGVSIGNSSSNITLNDPSHTHGSTGPMSANAVHTHTMPSGGEHVHGIITETGTSSGQRVVNATVNGGAGAVRTGIITIDGSTHSHTINQTNIDHVHSIGAASSGISLTDGGHSHTANPHSHTIDWSNQGLANPTITNDIGIGGNAPGLHIHGAANWSGSIGRVTGGAPNGNDNITTTGPSINSTDSSGTLTSNSTLNTPYLILNYIIRAL